MKQPKVTVVGAGFVGATTAQRIVEKGLADCVMIDIVEGLPQGKALDMMHSAPLQAFTGRIIGTNDYKDTQGSDLVIITAGLARKPGMSRDDLLFKNAEIVSQILDQIVPLSPQAVLVIVTNPLDVMTYLAWKRSRFEPRQVVGMSGLLDSARYATVIADELGVPLQEVKAMVLGSHGDSMVPLPRYSTWKGTAITQLVDKERLQAIHQKTRDMGAEIVRLLKTGSAFYAPSAACLTMAEAILKGSR
jgi:malate dehydrogenase